MCDHDPLYQQEHESAGGVGCPICNAERRALGAQVAANIKHHGFSPITPQSFAAWAEAEFDRGTCPECGGNLYEVRGAVYCNQCDRVIPSGCCPICGLSLTEHPHSEQECMTWFAEDYADQDQTIRDLWQF